MKQLLSFMAILCLPFAPLFAQQDSSYMCPGDTTELNHYGLSFTFDDDLEPSYYHTDALLWLVQEDGTASLTGNFIQPNQPANGFIADIHFVNGMNWEAWSSQFAPTSYMDDNNVVGDEYLNWTYYIMDGTNSTLTGFGVYEGTELELAHAPTNNYYAYQVGMGANQQTTLVNGHGGWAMVQGTWVNTELGTSIPEFMTSANIYLTYGCEPIAQSVELLEPPSLEFSLFPNPAEAWIAVQLEDHVETRPITYTLFDAQGKDVLRGQLVGSKIDVSNLAPGSYLLSVAQGEMVGQLKFVKE